MRSAPPPFRQLKSQYAATAFAPPCSVASLPEAHGAAQPSRSAIVSGAGCRNRNCHDPLRELARAA